MKNLIDKTAAVTVKELIENLQEMVEAARLASQADVRPTADIIYVTINSDSVRAILLEETLTDGSKVYNVELSEVTR